MRFGDVQDTRKKENKPERKNRTRYSAEGQMGSLAALNRERKMVNVYGVTFTI